MKLTKSLWAVCLTLFICSFVSAQDSKQTQKTLQYKVYGNCGMCKKRIDGSLKGAEGVKKASWNKDTKMMNVSYDPSKISEDQIHQKVANVGHDTEKKKAADTVYNKLPGCCQYERSKNTK